MGVIIGLLTRVSNPTWMVKRTTATDVAQLAGVSRTTVSFVLNNVPGMRISPETRQRVLDAAQELDYQPNISARRLVTGQTRILAYVERQAAESAFSDAFFPLALRGVHDAALNHGYEVLFAPIPISDGDQRCTGLLRGRHVDGLILSGPRDDDDELRRLLEEGAQIVVQGQLAESRASWVDVDNVSGAQVAVDHLIELGHTDVAAIIHAPLAYTAAAARLEGFRKALEAHGLAFDPERTAFAQFTAESGREAMESLLDLNPIPSAVFISSDTVAIGAVHAVRRRGFRIPDDVAIVGFDDIPMAAYTRPPLTTIHLPAYGLGWGAADLLIRQISREEVPENQILLSTDLVVRGSCGANP
jgi:DNA-binding LacI/PurR family transcriptional regulator